MIAAGTDLFVLQRRLGHESITTTTETYAHLMPDQQRVVAEAALRAPGGLFASSRAAAGFGAVSGRLPILAPRPAGLWTITMHFLVLLTELCMVNTEREVRRLLARTPMRTVRAVNLVGLYAHPGPELAILHRRGVVHRLAHGMYCEVPVEHTGGSWRPTREAATAAVATVLYGDRVPVLTGLTAARMHRALPRAIGVGYVAVPTQRRPLRLADRDGEVRFVTRAVADLDAVAMATELGQALVTTPEQTVLDLARADPRAEDLDAQEAIDALWPECDPGVLEEIAGRQRMRTTYERVAENR